MQKGGAQQLSGIFIHIGGGYTTLVEYLSRGGGVHHLNGIFFPASHFPQCSILPPFFFFGGGLFPCVAWSPILPNFQFS